MNDVSGRVYGQLLPRSLGRWKDCSLVHPIGEHLYDLRIRCAYFLPSDIGRGHLMCRRGC